MERAAKRQRKQPQQLVGVTSSSTENCWV
jgi:hypothetical protein